MKQKLLFFGCLFFVGIAYSQVTNIRANRSLQPFFAIDSTKGFLHSLIDSTMWITNATALGTKQLSTKIKTSPSGGGGMLNGRFIFVGRTDSLGQELYITNATNSAIVLLRDINTGAASSSPDNFVVMNGKLYFTSITPATGRELWVTDGTTAGTRLVKDIVAGVASSNTIEGYEMFTNGKFLLFSAKTTGKGYELWKSNGTTAGTLLLKDINVTVDSSSNPGYFFSLDTTTVLFSAYNGTTGNELWKTNGTSAGTLLVKDINTGKPSSLSYTYFFKFKSKAYFTANTIANGGEIWSTDGTTLGTSLLKDIWAGPQGSYAQVSSAMTIGSKFFFTAFSVTNGFEMWQSDGTTVGTTLFKDIIAGPNSGYPIFLLAYKFNVTTGAVSNPLFMGNKFFFIASTTAAGSELWVCDGTVAGTKLVKDIRAGTQSGLPEPSYFYTTTAFYFAADNGINGNELWKTDGTLAGTSLVYDINPGLPSGDINLGFVVNHKLVFGATNGDVAAKDLYCLNTSVTALKTSLDRKELIPIQTDELTVKIMGNPVKSQLNYYVNGLKEKANVCIMDLMGRIIINKTSSTNNGNNSITIDRLQPGLYLLVVDNGIEKKIVKFVKE